MSPNKLFVDLNVIQAIILGIIQGITEFFPISSSGHLVLAENLFELQAEKLFYFNVFVHIATLLAVIFYFRDIIMQILKGKQTRLLFAIIIGTIPAVLAALLFQDQIAGIFSKPASVFIAMLATAIFFLIAERFSIVKYNKINLKKAIWIGVAQAVSLIPGVSRSGSTLAAGLLTGTKRTESAKFSFLLAIPAIFGAGLFSAVDAAQNEMKIEWLPYFLGFLAALLSGYISIRLLMKLYEKHSLTGFAIYLIVIGGIGLI